jgi:hypothetical protein
MTNNKANYQSLDKRVFKKTPNQAWDFYVLLEVKSHFECDNFLLNKKLLLWIKPIG